MRIAPRSQMALLGAILLGVWSLDIGDMISGQAKENPQLEPPSKGNLVIKVEKSDGFLYCAVPHLGPYWNFPKVVDQLKEAVRKNGVKTAGPMIAIFYNSPMDVRPEELMWEVGFRLAKEQKVSKPLQVRRWPAQEVAIAIHVGWYQQIGATIAKMYRWIKASGYEPAGLQLYRYLDDDPLKVSPDKLRTEIWIPIKKKRQISPDLIKGKLGKG